MNIHDTATTARRTIASYDSYEHAQALVDRLADDGFPVQHLTIVASDLRLVERVTGRLNAAKAALTGASWGALWGVLFGWLSAAVFTHDGVSSLAVFLYWLLGGAAFGALFGLVAYLVTNHRRDFTSVAGIEAARYDVLADVTVADQALRRGSAMAGTAPSW